MALPQGLHFRIKACANNILGPDLLRSRLREQRLSGAKAGGLTMRYAGAVGGGDSALRWWPDGRAWLRVLAAAGDLSRRASPVHGGSRFCSGLRRRLAAFARAASGVRILLLLVAALFAASPALAQTLSVGINSNGTGDATGVEGDSLTFTVKMSATKGSNVTLKWRFVAGTAGSGDYSHDGSQNLTISTGSTSTNFVVDISDDARHEDAETFDVEIYDAVGATISRSKAQVTINVDSDNPDAPQFRVNSASADVDEDAGWATVTVEHWEFLSEAGDITIPYSAVGITATDNLDFDATGGTVTFPRGRLETRTVQIRIVDDFVPEGDETFEVRFGTPSAGEFTDGANKATVTILMMHNEEEKPPTAANGTVETGADADYGFAVADFNFSDANGDALSSVTIVTLPGRGTLKLGAANVRAGDTVLGSQLNAGDLTYTPPRGQVGEDMSNFNFTVNDGQSESAKSYRMDIDVKNKLAGNLEQTPAGSALSLPVTGASAYAQRIRTGSSAQEIEEVRLAIAAPGGVTPKVSIWYGRGEPERELTNLALPNPSNIHAAAAVKSFKANSKTNGRYSLATDSENYWIVVERAVNTGVISLKQTTAGNDATAASGWALTGNHWKKGTSDSWSQGTTGALQAELRTVAWRQLSIRVLGLEFSDPGPDELYTHGEELRITATLSEPANIPGTLINLPPHFCGQASIARNGGNGTNEIVFRCTIKDGPHTRVYVEANRVIPGSGGDGSRLSDTNPPAENTVKPCGVSFPDEIWCGELTVGGTIDVETGFASGEYGSLFPGQFTYDGTGYTVIKLRTDVPNTKVAFNFIPDTEHAKVNQAGFHLRLGTHSYAFPADTSAGAIESWDNTDPGWSVGDQVFVRLTGPTSGNQVEVEAPTIEGAPAVSEAGDDSLWTEGETVEVTLTFSEAVTVDTTNGVPSVGLGLGGLETVRSAAWLRGSGTAELVFGYTLIADDGDHAAMAVTPDSLALNGGTIRSIATDADAALGHVATIVLARPPRVPEGPSARFDDLPENHDGATAFTVELNFSAEPEGLSYRTVQDGLLEVEGGSVTRAVRATPGSNMGWRVTVAPSGDGDIEIGLPARKCGKPHAVCIGGRPLEQAAQAAIPGTASVEPPPPPEVPLTASFSGAPAEHTGSGSFELQFRLSEEPAGVSYRTVQNGLFDVTGATIGRAWRLQKGNNAGWGLRVEPSGFGDVTLVVRTTTDCAGTHGVCTSDGRMLGGGLQATIAGPPTLSVADAEVDEGAGATLDFEVTLNRALNETVTVGYRTVNGSASAGADYTSTNGTLTFAAGETLKTVSVPVLDDVHDEGSETLTLRLQSPAPTRVKLAHAEATGTINNTDAMPQAWLARFGRTVGEHAIEAVEARLQGPRTPGLSGSIGGQQLSGLSGAKDAAAKADEADTRQGLETLTDWLSGKPGAETDAGAFESLSLSGREALTGSSFAFTGGTAQTGLAAFWGRGAVTRFDGREGELTLDGEVASAMLGADFSREEVLGGLMVSHSRGEGGYRSPAGSGEVASTLTAIFPYARYALSKRVSVWGMAGYGEGTLTLTPEGQAPMRPDMDLLMGAVGVRAVLVNGGTEGPTLAAKSDAMTVRTSTGAVTGLAGSEADVTRLRLALEGSQPFNLGGDAVLTPSLELGVRHDGGDAETGFGADIGAGLILAAPSRGLSAELRARGMLTHEADGLREWGVSGTLAWDPAPNSDRGISLNLSQTVGGPASGGADALLARSTLAGLDPEEDEGPFNRRLEARLGYGIGVFGGRWTAVPEFVLGLSGIGRELRLGARLTERVMAGLAFGFAVEATRREDGDGNPQHGLGVGLGWQLAGPQNGILALEMRLEAARLEAANGNRAPNDRVGFEITARW